jgi:peptidoglycan/xylan/chitin deacetylase (PgdA/CDA1 family)
MVRHTLSEQAMKAITIMYHDVVPDDVHATSGFPAPDAALYKIPPAEFDRHLKSLAGSKPDAPIKVFELSENNNGTTPWMLTFDDGGVSAYTEIAGRIEALGWRGHFLITTDRIDSPPFVSRDQIRELHACGHVIGTHSCSHPLRMASYGREQLLREWRDSIRKLEDILGQPVQAGSIPGGQLSKEVAATAAEAGLKFLFTSEPTTNCRVAHGCLLLGRYAIQRRTPPELAARLASGRFFPCARQSLSWNSKKIIKMIGGEYYLRLRTKILRQ